MRHGVMIISIMLFQGLLGAAEFSGNGFGRSVKEAKIEALADLSQNLKSEVNSVIRSDTNVVNDVLSEKTDKSVTVTSNLPILGAEFTPFEYRDEVEVLATLYPQKVKALYRQKLDRLYDDIEAYRAAAAKAKDNLQKSELYRTLLVSLREYDRYAVVAAVLEVAPVKKPTVSIAEVRAQLMVAAGSIDSITMAALQLAKPFKAFERIYVYPPKPPHSHEVTPFSKAISLELKKHLNTVTVPSEAKYWLRGEYTLSEGTILLSYTLYDAVQRQSQAAATAALPAKAYAAYRAEPQQVSFDQLLHDGVIVSGAFNVQLSTNRGDEDLLFLEKEEIRLMVKLRAEGYYYLVDYILQDDGKAHAYLLDLSEFEGSHQFVNYVSPDEANRWVDLGTFKVLAPFGVERLQVIASPQKITDLPYCAFDDNGMCAIQDKPMEALVKTRAISKKKIAKDKKVIAEAVMTFTTMQP